MKPKITWAQILAPYSGELIQAPPAIGETLYRMDVYDTAGVKQFTLTDFTFLAYRKSVNAPGILQFGIRGDHPMLAALGDKWQIEIWRRPAGFDWVRDYVAIFRQPEYTFVSNTSTVLLCPGLMSMLSWRIVNWPANVASRSTFSAAKGETVMKTLVTYNATGSATTGNGRKRNGAITGISVESDSARGNTVTWYCAQDELLKTLQDLTEVAGGDFDLVKTSPTAFSFRWGVWSMVNGALTAASDRSASVVFAIERGNMSNVRFRVTRINEKTVACVWGQGEDSARDYVTRTGPNYDTDNDIEVYVDAKDVALGDTAGLNSRGDNKISALAAASEFEFTAVQAPATLYGVHYFLGDIVKAINPFTGSSVNLQVSDISISLDSKGVEKVVPMFREV